MCPANEEPINAINNKPAHAEPIEELEGKHYDIGLFGTWFGQNYGSTLTYFALRKTLIDMGFTVLMIDKPFLFDSDIELSPTIHPRIFARENGYEISPPLKSFEMHRLNSYCDIFMVGSDQVWNYEISNNLKLVTHLPFVDDDKKRISYAASFGHNTSFTPNQARSDVAKHFSKFDAISVRELDAVNVLLDEFGIAGTPVIDPVFLLDSSVYSEAALPPKEELPNNGYLLAYVLDPTGEIGRIAKEVADKMELELIVLMDGRDNPESNTEAIGIEGAFRCPDAHRWLHYIANAQFVITDSFHGTCFSLLFHRNVVTIGNERGVSRIFSLIETFQLQNILATNTAGLKRLALNPPTIDFERFDRILAMERARSMQWLKDALEAPKTTDRTINTVTEKECCGCAACYSICPTEAITMAPDSEGFLYPQINDTACIKCGKCQKACPSLNPKLEKSDKPLCFAAYTKDPVREISSSGGLFSLIANKVLDEGGQVCGAAFDEDFNLVQTWAKSHDELDPLRKSKYMQSFTGNTYREAKEVLEKGKQVLYVGCPCQVAGLNSFLGKDYDNLTTVDLLCHGGPSQKVFQHYLKEVHAEKNITYIGFRDKEHFGWLAGMTVKYADGEPYIKTREEDFFHRAFLHCFSVRPHCQVCNYSRLPRQGDLTLGDFWGVQDYNPSFTDGRGTSIVSVNSKRGLQTVEELWGSLDLLESIPREHVLTHGQPYGNPFTNNPTRNRFFRLLEEGVSFEKTLECCERNIFDFALLYAHGDTYGDALRALALQKTLAQAGHSVLVVRRPQEIEHTATPTAYRFTELANVHVPALSAHKTMQAQHDLKHYCRGFVMESHLSNYPDTNVTGGKQAVVFSDATKNLPVNPILLLDQNILKKLFDAESETPFAEYIASYIDDENGCPVNLPSTIDQAEFSTFDLKQDMSIGTWLRRINQARCVFTDNEDVATVAMVLGTPVCMIDSRVGKQSIQTLRNLGIEMLCINSDEALIEFCINPVACDMSPSEQAIANCKQAFIEAARNGMGNLIERPKPKKEPSKNTGAKKPAKKKHGKVYRAISRRIPKPVKRKIKKVLKMR